MIRMKQKLKQLKQIIPYLMFLGLLFYLAPMLISDTGSAIFFLLGVFPALSFGCSFIFALKQISFWNILFIPVLFIPSGLIFYQWPFEAGIFYALAYTLIAFIGHLLGIGFSLYSKHNKIHKKH